MTTWIVIGIVLVVAIIAAAVVLMTQTPSASLGVSTGGGGGGLWSSILGIGGSAISSAGSIIDQQTAHSSDPAFRSSGILTEQYQ